MKPFPPPPGFAKPEEEYDPRLTDMEIQSFFEMYLTPTQRSDRAIIRFILKYMECRNHNDAAEHAGFDRSRGLYLRSRPEIHAVIDAMTAKQVMKYGYDAHEVVERAKEIATIDPIEFQNPDGSFKTHLSQIRPEARRAIKKFKAKNIFGQDGNGMPKVIGQLIEIEVWDKMKGLELLGTEKNIFKRTTVHEHDVTANMASLLLESGRRGEDRKMLLAREVGDGAGETERSAGSEGRSGDILSDSNGGGTSDGERPSDDIEIVSGQKEIG